MISGGASTSGCSTKEDEEEVEKESNGFRQISSCFILYEASPR